MSKSLNNALDAVERIHGIVNSGEIINQEIRIHCPSGQGEYSVALNLEPGIRRKFSRVIKFHLPELRRLEVRSMPTFRDERKAVVKAQTGFQLHTNYLSDSDTFLLTFHYDLPDDGFLDSIVSQEYDLDPEASGDTEQYWMSAQLKHLRALQSDFGVIDLRDMDFLVDVAVHQDIKDVVPKPFVKELEIISKLIRETERQKKMKLAMEHLKTRGGGSTGEEGEVLTELQNLFVPSTFRGFVDVKDEFMYSGVRRGAEFYDNVPFRTFPKHMTVISRADLSLDQPAAHGTLEYRKMDFQEQLEKLFPRAMRRLKEK